MSAATGSADRDVGSRSACSSRGFQYWSGDDDFVEPDVPSAVLLRHPNRMHQKRMCGIRGRARRLPLSPERGVPMDLFFVKKQIVVGAVLLGVIELSVLLANVLRH
jgi:hypothetical protein